MVWLSPLKTEVCIRFIYTSCVGLKYFMGTKFDNQDKVILCFQISTIAESEDSQESVDSVTDSQKRREILSRRPSYRYVI